MRNLKKLKLLIVTLVSSVVLSGCAVIDAFMMEPFDNNEYLQSVKVRTKAQIIINKCANAEYVKTSLDDLKYNARLLKNYTEFIDYNEDAHSMASNLYTMIDDTRKIYDNKRVSVKYCEIKFETIINSASTIQKALGGKPR